jgi:hypothetical protein
LQQPVDALAEGDVDAGLAAPAMQHVDGGLTGADRHVHARHPFVTRLHELLVELHAEVGEPLDHRSGGAAEAPRYRHVDRPPVHLEVFVQQSLPGVLDAERPLEARAGTHHQAAREARRAADDAFALGHQHPAGAGFVGGEGGAQTGGARADDEHVDVAVHGRPQTFELVEPAGEFLNMFSESNPMRLSGTISMTTRPGVSRWWTNASCCAVLSGRTLAASAG